MLSRLLADLGALAAWSLPALLLLLKATLILVAALAITLVMQRASAGARHLVWFVSLGALLLVPALGAWGPLKLAVLPAPEAAVPTPILESPHRAAPAPFVGYASEATEAAPPLPPVTHDVSAGAPATPSTAGKGLALLSELSTTTLLLTLWAVVALGVTASLAWSALVVRRIVSLALPLDSADWTSPLYEVSDRLGLQEPPRLLRSDDTKMPFACGVLRPTIVLPADCDTWSLDRRHAVLLHELAHVRRHDLLGHTLGRLACAVYWFHPLVWTAAKRLRAESERACDDLALSCGARAADYAEHLLEIVTSVRRDATPSVALAMARRREFEGRMLAILDPELRHAAPGRAQSAVMIGSLAALVLVIGAAAPAPRGTAVQREVALRQAGGDVPAASWPQRQQQPAETTGVRPRRGSAVSKFVESETGAGVARAATSEASEPYAFDGAAKPSVDLAGVVTTAVSTAVTTAAATAETTLQRIIEQREVTERQRVVARQRVSAEQGRAGAATDDRPVLLAKVLQGDPSVELRRIAAWGLAQYADAAVAADALAAALRRDADAGVREMAAWALSDAREPGPAATEALSAALRGDASPRVRAIAAWTLGNVGRRGSSVEALTAALGDTSRDVRRRAVWALGNVEPRQAPPALLKMLGDPDPRVRELTAWALYNIEDAASVDALQAALRKETDKRVQLSYIRALAAIGEKSVDAIRGLLESPDPEIKSMAVRALAGGSAAGPWPWPWPEPRPNP